MFLDQWLLTYGGRRLRMSISATPQDQRNRSDCRKKQQGGENDQNRVHYARDTSIGDHALREGGSKRMPSPSHPRC
jgi:hypothetical protein